MLILAAALSFAAIAEPTPATPPTQAAAPARPRRARNRVVCTTTEATGSRMGSVRTCQTESERIVQRNRTEADRDALAGQVPLGAGVPR